MANYSIKYIHPHDHSETTDVFWNCSVEFVGDTLLIYRYIIPARPSLASRTLLMALAAKMWFSVRELTPEGEFVQLPIHG